MRQIFYIALYVACGAGRYNVWCGFHAGGVIGPYFFVDENDRHVTVNGERYRTMLEDYL